MKKIFYLSGEKLSFKTLSRWGFYRLIYFAILAKFGIVTSNLNEYNGSYFSIGTITPLPELWDKGYKVSFVGYVLWETVLYYQNPIPNNSNI